LCKRNCLLDSSLTLIQTSPSRAVVCCHE
jgi:hypothetical protein